jgi:hypothetical protein
VSRNYTLPTIKTLFGEASACGYPDCGEPLIFTDRGKKTAIAEIAHIRSESPGGPRYDADYTDDVDGPDNLLLLCGKHHKPVDRHESSYTVAELEMWKAAQRAKAGGGTPISEADLRSYVVLTPDDRQVLTNIARLAQRVVSVARTAQQEVGALRDAHEKVRMDAWARMGPIYGVDDDGTEHRIGSEGFSLSVIEQRKQQDEIMAAWEPHRVRISGALDTLEEEVAVLRMTFGGGPVTAAAQQVARAADLPVGDPLELMTRVDALNAAVAWLWKVANGEVDPD